MLWSFLLLGSLCAARAFCFQTHLSTFHVTSLQFQVLIQAIWESRDHLESSRNSLEMFVLRLFFMELRAT